MKRVGNGFKEGFKMGRWEVGFLQVGAWVFIGWYVIVNLVHCGYLCGGHGRSTELALQRSWYHRLLVGKVKRMMI